MRAIVFVLLTACSFRAETTPGLDAAVIDGAPDGPDLSLPLCPNTYGPINGIGMYRSVEGSDKSWQAAAADCNDDATPEDYRLRTHLVVLHDEVERLAITTGTPFGGNTWIGLNDLVTEGTFQWVTSEPTLGYPVVGVKPPWDTDDPDDAGSGEDCVRFKMTYVLEDKPCADTESYVCECDEFPPL